MCDVRSRRVKDALCRVSSQENACMYHDATNTNALDHLVLLDGIVCLRYIKFRYRRMRTVMPPMSTPSIIWYFSSEFVSFSAPDRDHFVDKRVMLVF